MAGYGKYMYMYMYSECRRRWFDYNSHNRESYTVYCK